MTLTDWLFVLPLLLSLLAFLGHLVWAGISDSRYDKRLTRERAERLERQRIIDLEHELLTGPFASHPRDCEQCKREGG